MGDNTINMSDEAPTTDADCAASTMSTASTVTSLRMGFQQRYKKENRKRKKKVRQYSNVGLEQHLQSDTYLLESIRNSRNTLADPFFKQKEENITTWSTVAGSENKLSLSLFYEATQRMWLRFWVLTSLTVLPIVFILFIEIVSPEFRSSINTNSDISSSPLFTDFFVPFNYVITFMRIFYNICEFVFMAFYFQFICECHLGDMLIHLHYYDTTDIDDKYACSSNEMTRNKRMKYYDELEYRLASIVWDWDRIASSTRDTSRAFRWWILTMVMFNFIAGVTAIVNLVVHSVQALPQHLEMYLPAVVNLLVVFYVLFSGTKVNHSNKAVSRRTYFMLASTHFGHVHVTHDAENTSHVLPVLADDGVSGPTDDAKEDEEVVVESSVDAGLEIKKQNLYIQAQTVARATTTRHVGISVYGLVLNRSLFLAFFSPFVAFLLFCFNTWLPIQ